jgi:hypothetical protein
VQNPANGTDPQPTPPEAAELAARLEWHDGGNIDVEAWSAFLDPLLPDDEQDDADPVRKVWAALLARRSPGEYDPPSPTPAPAEAVPGSEAKLRILEERAARGEALFHDDDPTADGQVAGDVLKMKRGGRTEPGRGVSKHGRRFQARATVDGRRCHLGIFGTEQEAEEAVKETRRRAA